MGLKNLALAFLSLFVLGCSNEKGLVSKLSDGMVEINYKKLTSANYLSNHLVKECGTGKAESDRYLDRNLRAAWLFPDDKNLGVGSYGIDFSGPKFNPNNSLPEGFIVPVKKGSKTIYHVFIDKDLHDRSENKEKLKDLGNGVYLMKSYPVVSGGIYAVNFRDGYSFYAYNLEGFWQ